MKTAAAFVLGVLTGLAFVRIPHYVGPVFNDQPETPGDHVDKKMSWNGSGWIPGWPEPDGDPDVADGLAPGWDKGF